MDTHDKDDRRGLWKGIDEFETGSELQGNTLICGDEIRELGLATENIQPTPQDHMILSDKFCTLHRSFKLSSGRLSRVFCE